MSGRGRPIRFLIAVTLGWIGGRAAILWSETVTLPGERPPIRPVAALPAQAIAIAYGNFLPPLGFEPSREVFPPPPCLDFARHERLGKTGGCDAPAPQPEMPWRTIRAISPETMAPTTGSAWVASPVLAFARFGPEESVEAAAVPPDAMGESHARIMPDRIAPLPDRWSASGWAVFRPGTGIGAAPGGGQIGGSQAGGRIAYMLLPSARIAAVGRVVTPMRGEGREVAFGAEWQPFAAPIRLVGEQRIGIDGTRGGQGLGLITGTDTALPGEFRLETYGQAGAVRRARIEPYADGAARMTRAIAGQGRGGLAIGAGVWGAAQRDAQRLDVGPSATLSLPVVRANLRLALDWRQRIAGRARPGSGLALTLGSDF